VANDTRFAHHIIFINHTAAGHFGNLSQVRRPESENPRIFFAMV